MHRTLPEWLVPVVWYPSPEPQDYLAAEKVLATVGTRYSLPESEVQVQAGYLDGGAAVVWVELLLVQEK